MRGTAQHSARFIEKRSTSLGQLDTSPDAVKQWHAMAPLQGSDRPRCRRLCDIQRFGRTRHMLSLCHANEYSQLLKRHD